MLNETHTTQKSMFGLKRKIHFNHEWQHFIIKIRTIPERKRDKKNVNYILPNNLYWEYNFFHQRIPSKIQCVYLNIVVNKRLIVKLVLVGLGFIMFNAIFNNISAILRLGVSFTG